MLLFSCLFFLQNDRVPEMQLVFYISLGFIFFPLDNLPTQEEMQERLWDSLWLQMVCCCDSFWHNLGVTWAARSSSWETQATTTSGEEGRGG
jgi:hypothetical protein